MVKFYFRERNISQAVINPAKQIVGLRIGRVQFDRLVERLNGTLMIALHLQNAAELITSLRETRIVLGGLVQIFLRFAELILRNERDSKVDVRPGRRLCLQPVQFDGVAIVLDRFIQLTLMARVKRLRSSRGAIASAFFQAIAAFRY